MGYACPVCEAPQADGEHLAHHLAVTALLHGEAHAAWLDDHVPGWTDRDPNGLAAAVVEHAAEIEHETVFEDTAEGAPPVEPGEHRAPGTGELGPEARRIYEEALELTRQRRAEDEE